MTRQSTIQVCVCPATSERTERGSLLVLLLLLIIPLAVLAASVISLGSRQLEEHDSSRGQATALLNAESGLDRGLAQLLDDSLNTSTISEMYPDGLSLKYQVEFEQLGSDGLDNDLDGAVDEADESQLIRLLSRGSMNVLGYDTAGNPVTKNTQYHVKEVQAFGRQLSGLPSLPYAVYLGDPLAELQLNGNAFLVDGNDYEPDLTPGVGPAVPGIATTGDPLYITDQIKNNQEDNVLGEGGPPSVANTTTVDLQAIIDLYKSSADIQFVDPNETYTGNLGDPYGPSYKVTHAIGNLDISGGGYGAGLLLVEGNLEVTGSFEYHGIIVVTGQVVFRGGGGTKRVLGTVLVGGDIENEDIELSGTVDVLYSSSIQDAVGGAVSSFTLFGWQEL